MAQIEKKQCQNSNLEQDIHLHLKNQHFWFMVPVQANLTNMFLLVFNLLKNQKFRFFFVEVANLSHSMLNILYFTKM